MKYLRMLLWFGKNQEIEIRRKKVNYLGEKQRKKEKVNLSFVFGERLFNVNSDYQRQKVLLKKTKKNELILQTKIKR